MTPTPCQTVVELLPWLLNGSLDAAERGAVEAHLHGCAACRAELAETAAMWEIFDLHVPAWDLAVYSQGLAPSKWSYEEVHHHLAACARCRRELALAQSDAGHREAAQSGAGGRRAPIRVPPRPWRSRLSLAAAIFVAALVGVWVGRSGPDPGVPGRTQSGGIETSANRGDTAPEAAPVLYADSFESGTMAGWSLVSLDAESDSSNRPASRVANPQPSGLTKAPAKEM